MTGLDHYSGLWQRIQSTLPGMSHSKIAEQRQEAWNRFEQTGLPNPRSEAWRYSSLQGWQSHAFMPKIDVEANNLSALGLAEVKNDLFRNVLPKIHAAAYLVFVDGHFSSVLSKLPTISGVEITQLTDLLMQNDPYLSQIWHTQTPKTAFGQLNRAFVTEGVVIRVSSGVVVPLPIVLCHVATQSNAPNQPLMQSLHHVIDLQKNASATIWECYLSTAPSDMTNESLTEVPNFTNLSVSISLGQSACLNHIKSQDEAAHAFHLSHTHIQQAEHSSVQRFSATLGSQMSRDEVEVQLSGDRTQTALSGLYLLNQKQQADHVVAVSHQSHHGQSTQTYKGVLSDQARTYFQGKILVAPHTLDNDAKQMNQNVLLSPKAVANSQPILEIDAQQVSCAHGATVGMLDDDALFYLRSRGLGAEQARRLLIEAFAQGVLPEWMGSSISLHVGATVENKLCELSRSIYDSE